MNWRIQAGFAGMLAALGLYILFNPVTIVSLATGVIPWVLVGAGAIYILSIFLRSRRRPITMILPALIGSLLLYAGLSMKFGDPASVGPVSLAFLFALLLFGSGAVKLLMALTIKRSKYFRLILGSGVLSAVMGILVLANWAGVSASLIGVLLGLELLGDALVMGALALRDRDGEEVLEEAGLDPVEEAAKEAARLVEQKALSVTVAAAAIAPPAAAEPADPVETPASDAGEASRNV
jgi:uncharacterized membrane protein HdeD (DUF308 family)